ncbi:MAG: cystathionine gamma-synthase [Thermoplasmata archaeon]|jgi:methionine-gamma-lyase|nr:cystathionine gamma-synthase [Thermoplasmata archaeon]
MPGHPYGAINPPIVRSSTFSSPTAAEAARRFAGEAGLVYSRMENPTVAALEQHLAELEGAEACVATASGMAAIHCALMAVLKPGARVVADPCVYGCTHTLLDKLAGWGVEVVRCDTADPDALKRAIGKRVDAVFIETPMNPTLRVVDLRRAADWTHKAGGKLVVDNTFCTPLGQRPLEFGADLVVHSLTKGVNGHSDLLAGAVLGSEELVGRARDWRKDAGAVLDADTAWLVLRGARTLRLRVEAANQGALDIAESLEAEGFTVRHPMLSGHPDHEVAASQMEGCCVLTLDLGSEAAAMGFLDRLEVFTRAVSLGGYESLASHPASTTHSAMPEAHRRAAGITPGLVRLSIGIEGTHVLLEDVLQALARRPAANVQVAPLARTLKA